jgi:zinc transport system substrate-binding protein
MIFRRHCIKLFLVVGFFLISIGVSATPRVVVSITPVHSLVSSVMQGIAEPALLVSAGQSPHASRLRPSLMRELSRADLLVWVSPDFEISLKKAVSQLKNIEMITLIDSPAMHLLDVRNTGAWQEEHRHTAQHTAEALESIPDYHLWLSPYNARMIVEQVANVLIDMDPSNADQYRENMQQTIIRIEKTRAEIEVTLAAFKTQVYMVYHDAYQYLEREFSMNAIGSMTQNPERKAGLKSLLNIKQSIVERNVKCLFYEPQFQPRMLKRLADQTGLSTGELDPVGANIAAGPDQWFELMFALRDGLAKCL